MPANVVGEGPGGGIQLSHEMAVEVEIFGAGPPVISLRTRLPSDL